MSPDLVALCRFRQHLCRRLGASLLLLVCSSFYFHAAVATERCYDLDHELPAGVDSESGYRMQRYRAAVPDSLAGGCVVDKIAVAQAFDTGAWRFIDVYPPKGLGPDPLDGHWIISEKHNNIEGSTWLPEVGRGHLEPEYEDYLARNLNAISNGNKSTPLLFYCTSDCWQSWNAARRAISRGYTRVLWFPAGIDGWLELERQLVPAQAINFLATYQQDSTDVSERKSKN